MPPEQGDADELAATLREFTAYLRDPESAPAPEGVSAAGLAVYRDGVFLNCERFLRDNFPRVRESFDDAGWNALVRDYFRGHSCETPLFVELPREFLSYLEHERDNPEDPPYLTELADFEWLETEVSADLTTLDLDAIERDGDLLAGTPVVNPTVRLRHYRFPVHVIGGDHRPDAPPPQPTFIAAYRDSDQEFRFTDLSGAAVRLVELMVQNPGDAGCDHLASVAAALGRPGDAAVISAGSEILQRMLRSGLVLGTRPA